MEEYEKLCAEADADPEGYWARRAENLHWFRKWDKFEWNLPHAKWFVGGYNQRFHWQLPRSLTSWRRNKAAIIWKVNPVNNEP